MSHETSKQGHKRLLLLHLVVADFPSHDHALNEAFVFLDAYHGGPVAILAAPGGRQYRINKEAEGFTILELPLVRVSRQEYEHWINLKEDL